MVSIYGRDKKFSLINQWLVSKIVLGVRGDGGSEDDERQQAVANKDGSAF